MASKRNAKNCGNTNFDRKRKTWSGQVRSHSLALSLSLELNSKRTVETGVYINHNKVLMSFHRSRHMSLPFHVIPSFYVCPPFPLMDSHPNNRKELLLSLASAPGIRLFHDRIASGASLIPSEYPKPVSERQRNKANAIC